MRFTYILILFLQANSATFSSKVTFNLLKSDKNTSLSNEKWKQYLPAEEDGI